MIKRPTLPPLSRMKTTLSRREESRQLRGTPTSEPLGPAAHLVPGAIVVWLWTPDLHPLLAHVEGEDQLSMGQEQRHEVLLQGI